MGAGISGLTLARLLDEQGQRVLVLDKGRGPGGRVSSKTLEGSLLDTAAIDALSADSDVQTFLSRYAGARWHKEDAGDASRWSFSEPARVVMQGLSGTLPVQHTFVTHLVRHPAQHLGVVRHGFGEPVWAKRVVLALPVPQAQAIIAHSDFLIDYDLDSVDYTKRQVLLAVFEGENHVPDSSWSTDLIDFIRFRPRPDGLLGVEAFARESWSEATWDQDATISQGRLLREMGELFDGARVWGSTVMRWRYAEPRTVYPKSFWSHPEFSRLTMIGDAFGEGQPTEWGISRAVRSALDIAPHVGR